VMIEAMACGTPVIAYRRGSVPEVIEDGLTGFLVPDVASAADAVAKLDCLDRRVIRARFEQRFTAERMANDYISAYRSLRKLPLMTPVPDYGISKARSTNGEGTGAANAA
jgi:glycosyltransferase involved in cell wall biosynthesis